RREVGLDVQVLNLGKSIIGVRAVVLVLEDVEGIVAMEGFTKLFCEQLFFVVRPEVGDGIEVALERRPRKALQCGFGAENTRCPSKRRIPTAKRTEYGTPERFWKVISK